jgi:hypothetical protein
LAADQPPRIIMRRIIAVVALALFATSTLHAQSPFAPLEFLVGNCWRGTFPGSAQTDEHCFEWVFDHKFVRDRHAVRGGQPYGGETIYFWDVEQKRIAFSYWNTEGQMMQGFIASAAGDSLTFVTSVAERTGRTELRSTWTRHGDAGYRVTQFQRSADSWKEIVSMEKKRTARGR